ncbi:unnamed protein product [marine sediment metagenome]|uniref:Gfo/Idh/MocA-like oxidoreductase N-terminal domain-containing protein n=1 Tax=marine sediment metagenome TaxID=412755 RepID=X1PBG2_9ZZZZ
MSRKHINRRRFLAATATVAAITIVPRQVLGGPGHTPPSEKLNIAGIGIGGMGKSNLRQLESENIVALCDVDREYAAKTFKRYPKAKTYTDFRKMLDKEKNIDAAVIPVIEQLKMMLFLIIASETTCMPSPAFQMTLPSTMLVPLPPPYTKMPGYFLPILVS